MDKNDKKTEIVETPKVPEETVSVKKKLTRKFTWTPARKAAFEKCVAAVYGIGAPTSVNHRLVAIG